MTTGLGSIYKTGCLTKYIEKFEDLPVDQVKDLTGEVTLLRGILAGLLDSMPEPEDQDSHEAQLLWQTSETLRGMVDTIAKVTERMERIENGLKVNLNARQVTALAGQIVEIINQEVADPQVRQTISERIANIFVIAP